MKHETHFNRRITWTHLTKEYLNGHNKTIELQIIM